MDRPATVLKATGLAVARGGRRVLEDVGLELRRGEVVALLGPNGAGKSSLVRVLAGLERPAAGRVEAAGRTAAVLQEAALARRTALANVEAALAWWGVRGPQRGERALAALETMGVGDLASRPVRSMSGGEARRVHIARGLALDPDLLLLDEPFAGLDAPVRAELLAQSSTAIRSEERATLVVVHDRAEAWALADRVIVVLDGRVAADGPLRAVMERPPSPAAARFLGFTGQIVRPDGSLLAVRPRDVVIDPEGDLEATVRLVIADEQGIVCDADVSGGTIQFRAELPGPQIGEVVRCSISGGFEYAGGAQG